MMVLNEPVRVISRRHQASFYIFGLREYVPVSISPDSIIDLQHAGQGEYTFPWPALSRYAGLCEQSPAF
jgi:hypothetical protein